ncbi:MAG TPA: hypothetical protein VKV23_05040 [Acidimicrobiales bacterium]|nr:hypothetical protein [Acidimicrobiales bacterium]
MAGTRRTAWRVGVAAGLGAGLVLAGVRLAGGVARRRRHRRERAFARAARDLWPALPGRAASPLRVAAERVDAGARGDQAGEVQET